MERGSITKWLLFGLAIFLLMTSGRKAFFGSKPSELQPWGGIVDETSAPAASRPKEEACVVEGPRFKAELSTYGASLRHLWLKDYAEPAPPPPGNLVAIKQLILGDTKGSKEPMDLVTTTTREGRMPLRVDLRVPFADDGKQQVPYDDLVWKVTQSADKTSCTFTYKDEKVALEKKVSLGSDPFMLAVDVTVQNLSAEPRAHRFAIEQTDWRTKTEMESHLGRQSELTTETVTVTNKTERPGPGDFAPSDFAKFSSDKWKPAAGEGDAKLAAVSSVYFSKVVIPTEGPGKPVAETQIEEIWDQARYPLKDNDPNFGHLFRARIAYPETKLGPGERATYHALSFTGPKERHLLQQIDHGTTEVLDLGMFTTIARGLVWYLEKLHGIVGSWGWAIVLLTITVRIVLFPLSLSQIKNSVAMRKLKPEMDAITEKYKDDMAQRGLAQQELWRKHGVSPMSGCLPMLVQMPVWWALYRALQTAVELYHVPFGPFIPDLSAPGLYLIIPAVLGTSSFIQQKIMPQQGDPQQQRLMLYMMPGMFTVMMLFLPAGLGVYMVTNSVLAIGQQLLMERYLKTQSGSSGPSGQIEVRDKTPDDKPSSPALGKGKARARG